MLRFSTVMLNRLVRGSPAYRRHGGRFTRILNWADSFVRVGTRTRSLCLWSAAKHQAKMSRTFNSKNKLTEKYSVSRSCVFHQPPSIPPQHNWALKIFADIWDSPTESKYTPALPLSFPLFRWEPPGEPWENRVWRYQRTPSPFRAAAGWTNPVSVENSPFKDNYCRLSFIRRWPMLGSSALVLFSCFWLYLVAVLIQAM